MSICIYQIENGFSSYSHFSGRDDYVNGFGNKFRNNNASVVCLSLVAPGFSLTNVCALCDMRTLFSQFVLCFSPFVFVEGDMCSNTFVEAPPHVLLSRKSHNMCTLPIVRRFGVSALVMCE